MNIINISNTKGDVDSAFLVEEISKFVKDEFVDKGVRIEREESNGEGTKGIITLSIIVSIVTTITVNILSAALYDIVKESIKRTYAKNKASMISCIQKENRIEIKDGEMTILTVTWEEIVD